MVRRGGEATDERQFSAEALPVLRAASRQVEFLLDEGYPAKSAATFVGNHHLLSERQRLAIVRSVAPHAALLERERRRVTDLQGAMARIDGFNTVITMEVLLCGSLLIEGMDGCVRDLAGLRGTYRPIAETQEAVRRILELLAEHGAGGAHFYLDRPVSNSGKLLSLIAAVHEQHTPQLSLDFSVIDDVDRTLMQESAVVSTDAVILDHCGSFFPLTALAAREYGAELTRVWEEG